jgi:hypothetical protein
MRATRLVGGPMHGEKVVTEKDTIVFMYEKVRHKYILCPHIEGEEFVHVKERPEDGQDKS